SSLACYDTSGDTAATYCSELGLGGYADWRLPTASELKGIVDYGKYNPAIDDAYINNVDPHKGYWSSTTFENNKVNAWVVGFNNGSLIYSDKDNKSDYYVRCVRDGQ
ncbi:MAG: DUF1566 domain-containing protein, partial [Gammaproteobacteria bacterium]|nr:DUF1566 domain-containing protein [Gammaproteobacteria bacterium]